MEFPADTRSITLEHMRAFIAVARSRSFQKAGEQLCRSQSAVTQSVKRLEAHLNCTLVERGNGHTFGLTTAGQRILPELEDTLLRFDAVLRAALQPELRGRITVGIPPSFSTVELQAAVARLLALNSDLQIGVISAMSADIDRMLADGSLDVALINQYRFDSSHAPEGIFEVLAQQPLHWASGMHIALAPTTPVPLATYSEGSPWRAATLEALAAAGRSYDFAYVSASYESLCSSVLAGFGITALPDWDMDGRFVILDGTFGLPPLPQVRTVLKTAASSAVLRQFCDFIMQLPFFKNLRPQA
ncbi:MAG TPA: LysR family transcriptional regulator [Desulfovibrio sp.]|uniref:LysR family transcriptional regulator n=1 Tax=Desulfovibrio sp. TaxID=885 RepID=UPI002D487F4E|nr:LysR family transcriptional regulator [Desulfovibrio sp.]HZF60127.1 LysR family transcriptional regulator [Desulfovibrio sp.]